MKNFIHWIRSRWLTPIERQVIGMLNLDEAGFRQQKSNRLAGCLAMKNQRPLAHPECPTCWEWAPEETPEGFSPQACPLHDREDR